MEMRPADRPNVASPAAAPVLAPVLALVLACLPLACRPATAAAADDDSGRAPAAASPAREQVSRLHAVLINGGAAPRINYQSHLLHLKQLLDLLLEIGVPADRITVFNSDGTDEGKDVALIKGRQDVDDFWRLDGTQAGSLLRTPILYESSVFERLEPRAATQAEITRWFQTEGGKLEAGDTLLVYVTDHGDKNDEDLSDNTISLWQTDEDGNKEALSVSELHPLLAALDPGVRVVSVMSQCFSGSFAGLIDLAGDGSLPDGRFCGYFSATADRKAYGCYPRNLGKLNVGHSFRFLHALSESGSLPAAHEDVLVTDTTPDVPLKTTDVYLEGILRRAAEARDLELDEFADRMIAEAWKNKAAWEPQVRLLDRIGEAFGGFSPRSLEELDRQTGTLPEISGQLVNVSSAWKASLLAANRGHLTRFLESSPEWTDRLKEISAARAVARTSTPEPHDKSDESDETDQTDENTDAKAGEKIDADSDSTETEPDDGDHADHAAAPEPPSPFASDEERRRTTAELLGDLESYARKDRAAARTVDTLHDNSESAGTISYRMEVRLAVVLRMRSILLQVAGQQYLATQGTKGEREAYRALAACENLELPPAPGRIPDLETPEAFPAYDDDVEEATAALPAWMGIRFRDLDDTLREKNELSEGAARVLYVYPDSPADKAGLATGDIIVGPPGKPFREAEQVRAWTMLSEINEKTKLDVLREGKPLTVALRPGPYPMKWPEMPGPPAEDEAAPPLVLTSYRGDKEQFEPSGSRLLFFWATWCGPCKAAVPELLELQADLGVQVLAITDEPGETLDAFFEHHDAPFPEAIAVDPLREAFVAYGVSGTPSFVYIDDDDIVRHLSTGYRKGELRKKLEDLRKAAEQR